MLALVNLTLLVDFSSRVGTARNQASRCGSCYAHSVAGLCEFQNWRETGSVVDYSTDYLVDCFPHLHKCGERPDVELEFLKRRGCVQTFTSCKNGLRGLRVRSIELYDDLHGLSVEEVERKINLSKPWIVGIASRELKKYTGGVARPRGPVDHAVLLVGEGIYNGEEVWICRNSWGPEWGYDGFFMMEKKKSIHYACTAGF